MRLLTFNVYFGFDGLSALNEPALGLQQFEETDIRARMMGLARFLAEHDPDVAGLQEMVRLSFTDAPQPEIFVDFLQILDECVAETGGPLYQRVLQRGIASGGVVNLNGPSRGFLFEEFNVLCVKPELQPREAHQMEFSAFATRSGVELRQGLQLVRARSGETQLQLLNTHLEAFSEPVRDEQARELLEFIAEREDKDSALIVFGDLNADPDSSVLRVLTGIGLVDTYAAASTERGATCCQTPELNGETNVATTRIDYVLARNSAGSPEPRVLSSEVVLNQRVARSNADGLVWPSDHFGVLSTVEFPRRKDSPRKTHVTVEQ